MDRFGEKMGSLPLPVRSATPRDPRLPAADMERRRPVLELRLPGGAESWQGLAAYASGQGRAIVTWDASTDSAVVRVQAVDPLERGRGRYNVTAPSRWRGRWYWYSHTWIVGEEHEN